MRIIHLINSDSINHIHRYVQEFISFVDGKILVMNNTITPLDIAEINSYDCVFIHSLPNDKLIYQKIIKNIKILKVLFIHQYTINELYKTFNKPYLKLLLKNCYRICLYNSANKVYDEISRYVSNEKIIQTELVYNFTNKLEYANKNNNFIFINHDNKSAQLVSKYLDLYNRYNEELKSFYHIYGISKNLTTINIDDLETINIVVNDIIKPNKLNLHNTVSYDKFCYDTKHSYFICDLSEHFTYGILDTISNGTLVILNSKLTKQYSDKLLNEKISSAELNEYIINKPKYISTTVSIFNVLKEHFNGEETIQQLISNIL